jgi:hypothetical protein
MAILVYFRANNPAFPPTGAESEWGRKLSDYMKTKMSQFDMSGVDFVRHFTLDNMDELNNFVRDYTLTDATLLDDIAMWKAAHGITYTGGFYDLSPGGGLILSVDYIFPLDTVAVDTSLI